MNLRKPTVAACLLAILLCAGCSDTTSRPSTVKVSGTVKYKGEPLKQGRISFLKKQGPNAKEVVRPAIGRIVDGAYELTTFQTGDGAIPGDYQVTIESMDDDLSLEEIGEGKKKPKSTIPRQYASGDTSGLKVTVPTSGPFTKDFDLK